MTLFTEEAREAAIAKACEGLDYLPKRGLNDPVREYSAAIIEIAEWRRMHNIAPRQS